MKIDPSTTGGPKGCVASFDSPLGHARADVDISNPNFSLV